MPRARLALLVVAFFCFISVQVQASSTPSSSSSPSFGARLASMFTRGGASSTSSSSSPDSDTPVIDVAIVGGGIGGLATALALQTLAPHLSFRLYERSPTLRGGEGTALTMWPNGLSALGAIDAKLLKRVKAAGSVIRKQTFNTPTQNVTEDTGVFESKYDEPLLSVFWKTLHTQLAQAVQEGGREGGREGGKEGPIVMGKACVDVVRLEEEEEGEEGGEEGRVLLTFDDGSRVRARCVLAADGVHSVLRQKFVGDGKPREHGRLIYRCVIPHPSTDREEMMGKINNEPSKLIHWQPCGKENTYWAVIKKGTPFIRRDSDPVKMKKWLLEEYADFPEILGMIEATPAEEILERPVIDRGPIKQWSYLDDRVLLIGDAAHAMILSVGQGANTALEDAVYIATYLRDAYALFPGKKGEAIKAAFEAFQNVRVKHCTDIQLESETYAKNAYGAPRTAAATSAKEGGKEGGKEERKLGGYRLVKFALVPFSEAYKKGDGKEECAVGRKE